MIYYYNGLTFWVRTSPNTTILQNCGIIKKKNMMMPNKVHIATDNINAKDLTHAREFAILFPLKKVERSYKNLLTCYD